MFTRWQHLVAAVEDRVVMPLWRQLSDDNKQRWRHGGRGIVYVTETMPHGGRGVEMSE